VATTQEMQRWTQVLKRITVPYDSGTAIVRKFVDSDNHPLPHTQAVEVTARGLGDPLIEAWEANPPRSETDLWEWIEPAYRAAKSFDLISLDPSQFATYVELVRDAQEAMSLAPETFTAADVLGDLELDLKRAVLAARVGHRGIMDLINTRTSEWTSFVSHGTPSAPMYLDLHTMRPVETRSYRTISYADLQATVHPGVASLREALSGPDESDQPAVMKFFAAQWVIYIMTEWDEYYRKRLADVYDCTKDDIRSELFADLNHIRQDYVHRRGIATKRNALRNTRLRWFTRGQQMIPKHTDYEQLYRELERELEILASPPELVERPRMDKVNATIPVELIQELERAAGDAGMALGVALESAVREWVTAQHSCPGERSDTTVISTQEG